MALVAFNELQNPHHPIDLLITLGAEGNYFTTLVDRYVTHIVISGNFTNIVYLHRIGVQLRKDNKQMIPRKIRHIVWSS